MLKISFKIIKSKIIRGPPRAVSVPSRVIDVPSRVVSILEPETKDDYVPKMTMFSKNDYVLER
jgi:hypothetical protein